LRRADTSLATKELGQALETAGQAASTAVTGVITSYCPSRSGHAYQLCDRVAAPVAPTEPQTTGLNFSAGPTSTTLEATSDDDQATP